MKRIFEYIDPDDADQDTRVKWIAAADEAQADSEARRRGWLPDGGEILKNHRMTSDAALLAGGVDVVAAAS